MKILSLNTAHGQYFSSLIPFVQREASQTDIFCFQEIFFGQEAKFTDVKHARINIFEELCKILPNFNAYTYKAPATARHFYHELLPSGVRGGIATFVNKKIKVKDSGGFRCYKTDTFPGFDFGAKLTGNCLWVDIGGLTILSLHGIYQRDTNKADTPERIEQAKIIKEFMKTKNTQKILCGDFNLLPENKSLSILEEDMVNLIDKFKIKSTRSSYYKGDEKFADYMLVSPDIKVKKFEVPSSEASDHLPLVLDFEV